MAEVYPLRALIREVAGFVVEERSHARLVQLLNPLMQRFLAGGDALPAFARRAADAGPAMHLVHEEGDHSFFIVTLVTPPADRSAVHSHSGWVVSGIVEGEEEEERFRRDERTHAPHAPFDLRSEGSRINPAGSVSTLKGPDEFHALRNRGAGPLIALDILAGTPEGHRRHVYDAASRTLLDAHLTFSR